jgi:superfamily II DNA/RNA helicase
MPADVILAVHKPKHSFSDFGLNKIIEKNLTRIGFTTPTRIQDESIPHILKQKDVIGLANTGSGKTAAFALPIIQKLHARKAGEKALIMAPTRELAGQINDELLKFAQGLRVYSAFCVGGMPIGKQIREVARSPHVIIGTPGRLKDLVNRKALALDSVTTLVLDEFDRMLDMGFIKDIEFLISKIPKNRQSLCFSATITPDIKKLLEKMLIDPVTVSAKTSETSEHIAQDVIRAGSKEAKFSKLKEMLAHSAFEKVLIFGEMKRSVQKLADELSKNGFKAEAIHGNKSQPQRDRALKAFRDGKVDILVATDVAARGLDIPNVSHVINFDQPNTREDYIHRIGRTGRAGKGGQAYTFIS